MTEVDKAGVAGGKQTDAAALLAGGVAIVLATYLDEGEYDLIGFIISVTITGTLLSYLLGESKSEPQRWAFAGAIGLAAMPAFGFIFELTFSDYPCDFFTWRESQSCIANTQGIKEDSEVGSLFLLLAWLVSAVATRFLDSKVHRQRQVASGSEEERGQSQ